MHLARVLRRTKVDPMVACLTLIGNTHRRVASAVGHAHTACGMALLETLVAPNLFVADEAEPTCLRCRIAGQGGAAWPSRPQSDQAAARQLIERAIGEGDAECLTAIISPGAPANPATGHPFPALDRCAAVVMRLHALFPGFALHIIEAIGSRGRIVIRYTVRANDPAGLLGSASDTFAVDEAVILTMADGHATHFLPLGDQLGLWAALSQPVY